MARGATASLLLRRGRTLGRGAAAGAWARATAAGSRAAVGVALRAVRRKAARGGEASADTVPRPGPPGLSGVHGHFRPLLIAETSSPLAVSPLNSQKNAPPRPWFLAQPILEVTVAGVS